MLMILKKLNVDSSNRIASPEEVANVVLFLCSEKSKIYTDCLDINGGHYSCLNNMNGENNLKSA